MKILLPAVRLFWKVAGQKLQWLMAALWGVVATATLFRAELLPVEYQAYTLHWLFVKYWHWWIIIALVTTITMMIFRYYCYYVKTVSHYTAALRSLDSDWPNYIEEIKLFRGYQREGELLKEDARGKELEDIPHARIEDWRGRTAYTFLQRGRNEEEARFKEAAKDKAPENTKLHRQINVLEETLKEIATQLVAHIQDSMTPNV